MLVAYFDWVRWEMNQDPRYEFILHVPNEGNRGKWGHIWARRKGLSPGVPDVLCPYPNALYQGFAMEAKSATGKATAEQTSWLRRLHQKGWACVIRRSFEEMRQFTEMYFNIQER